MITVHRRVVCRYCASRMDWQGELFDICARCQQIAAELDAASHSSEVNDILDQSIGDILPLAIRAVRKRELLYVKEVADRLMGAKYGERLKRAIDSSECWACGESPCNDACGACDYRRDYDGV